MRFFIVRVDDEVSSDLCKSIEETSFAYGGLEFPFIFEGKTYSKENVQDYFKNKSAGYYTGLFHSNCRCHLVPISSENSAVGESFDYIDEEYILYGVSRYLGELELEEFL
jgi:hypothetical protein